MDTSEGITGSDTFVAVQDCSKSHVSPAQKKRRGGKPAEEAKPTSTGVHDAVSSSANPAAPPTASASGPVSTAQVEGTSATASPSSTPAPTASPTQLIPGAGQRPCKFGPACTRPNCVFIHPWQTAGPATVPCKFGSACTRRECLYISLHASAPASLIFVRLSSQRAATSSILPNRHPTMPRADATCLRHSVDQTPASDRLPIRTKAP